jgi:iron complex transport system permease protein
VTEFRRARFSGPVLFGGLAVLLLAAAGIGLGVGAVDINPVQVFAILLDHLGIDVGVEFSSTQDAVLWSIRLPRVALGVAVGAALGIAGAAFQGIFRNPLADPQLIGISSGAAFGAVVAVLFLEGLIGSLAGPIGGVAGGIGAGIVVYSIARHQGRTEVVTLVLAGFAVAAIGGAGAAVLSVAADDARLGSVLFYSLGSLSIATWDLVWRTVPLVALAVVALPFAARKLDLVLLGEREAAHLGVDVERTRIMVVGLATAAVGSSVAAAGAIGFVGLLAPHSIRYLAGPGHRLLLPASALGGAVFVVLADAVARTIASPLEVPIGLLTAVVGGPAFLALLVRTRRRHGGWG